MRVNESPAVGLVRVVKYKMLGKKIIKKGKIKTQCVQN